MAGGRRRPGYTADLRPDDKSLPLPQDRVRAGAPFTFRVWIRRVFLASAPLLVLWSIAIAASGGFVIEIAGVRVSSRHVWNPLLIALLAACGAAGLSTGSHRGGASADARWWWSQLTAAAAWLRAHSFDVATLLAIAGTIRLVSVWRAGRPLWLDEEMIALNVRDRSLPELLGPLSFEQRAPFGWLAMERASGELFGFTELPLRVVPALFGAAMLVAALWAGRRWTGAVGAAALVALCGFGTWPFHYSLELKHYSADMFFGLLLPALAVWATEADAPVRRLRRSAVWWLAAAIGQWFANGALFVTPACAAALFVWLWRVDGWRRAVTFAIYGVGWFACLGVYYALTLRLTVNSAYMREYWAMALPPPDEGIVATVAWLAERAATFAVKPGGTEWALLFWTIAVCGFAVARRSMPGLMFATVPLSMALLGALRLVPIYERLSLWALPALYAGFALGIDAGVRWARDALTSRQIARGIVGIVLAVATMTLCADILQRGHASFLAAYPRDSNHLVDDRTGVTWLTAQSRHGDAVLTTKLALPALWWYGGGSGAASATGAVLSGGARVLEVSDEPPGSACDPDGLRRTLAPFDRALVYLGFRFDDVPDGFDDLLLRSLAQLGRVTESRAFAGVTRAAIVDLTGRAGPSIDDASSSSAPALNGCLAIRTAVRW